jgi:iron complex outermembrane receptor protein
MLSLLLGIVLLHPGSAGGITGRVTDSAGNALADVEVEVVEVHRHARTGADGHYVVSGLPSGTYSVSFALIGYRPVVRRINVAAGDMTLTLDVVMTRSVVEIPTLQVSASAIATSALTSPQPLSVLGGEALIAALRPTLGETVEQQPGLRNLSTGSGIGKPVIRGLSSNRVLVASDGLRLESQQWGDEHGPNVETADAERIEIIRGPASVLYGSDALGGVINVVRRPLPDALDQPRFLSGQVTAGYGTNREAPEGLVALEGADGGWGFRGSLAGRRSDDIRTPPRTLANSGYSSYGGSVAAGYRGSWGSVAVDYAGRKERVEIHEDPAEEPGFTGFQRIADDRVRAELKLPTGSSRLTVSGSWARNNRREFEEAGTDEVALGLLSRDLNGDVRLHHQLGAWAGIAGITGRRNTFEKFGEESLIPNSTTNGFGVLLFEQREAGRWLLSFGARYDYRRLEVENDADLGVTAGNRTWNSVTGNLGLLYRVSEPVALVLNVGRGFRAPSTFELFANGVHEGTVRFERGDATLENETSLNGDVALRVQQNQLRFEIGGFINRIYDYIYPDPTGLTDPGSGLQIFQYTAGNATLMGIEAGAELHPTTRWHLRAGADWVRGQNTTLDQPLPFVPPFRFTYDVRWEGGDGAGAFGAPYLNLGGETNVRQSRLDPEDFGPEGYTTVQAGAGVELALGGQRFNLDLLARNLFDTEYTSFMSRYKLYAPDPGRNITVRVSWGF